MAGDNSSGMKSICSQPEVADDVISCEDAESLQAYVFINLCVVSSVICKKIEIRHLCNA